MASGIPKSRSLRIKSVRGPLSADILRNNGYDKVPDIYGDVGLLVSQFFIKSDQRYDIGFFPHYTNANTDITLMKNSIKLRPMAPVDHTLKQLTACSQIVSSALHGIVVAESFNIPAVWVRISNSVPEFKFRDYYLGTGRKPPDPIDWTKKANWKAALEALDHWKPPQYSEDALLSTCPFNLERGKK
jgi:pyruvyltransferase